MKMIVTEVENEGLEALLGNVSRCSVVSTSTLAVWSV